MLLQTSASKVGGMETDSTGHSSVFSLTDLEQTANGQPDESGFVRVVRVAPDALSALIEAVNALDALYEDEWRMSADWGDPSDREKITDRAANALGRFKGREMDGTKRLVVYTGAFDLAWLADGETVSSAGDGTGACVIHGPGYEERIDKGDEIRVPRG